MEHFVTLFDSLFLPQGLALHMSMERHAGKATFVQDIEPTFDHPYYWNFGGDHKQQAMKLWGIEL